METNESEVKEWYKMNVSGKLSVNDIELKSNGELWYVRISTGEFMYFDTPLTTQESAIQIYRLLLDRMDRDE